MKAKEDKGGALDFPNQGDRRPSHQSQKATGAAESMMSSPLLPASKPYGM